MEEILEGVWHWTAHHPEIGIVVSSYWLEPSGVLIDPLVPEDAGLDWFAARERPPQAVLLSNRHHYRGAASFAARFGCSVLCNSAGLHEFTHGERVEGFEIGALLPGGVRACELGAICPDDTALLIPAASAMSFADAIVRGGPVGGDGPLGFVPDSLMHDPAGTKQGILAACGRLLAEHDFENLLLAHGGPVIGGRAMLEELVAVGGRTAFEM